MRTQLAGLMQAKFKAGLQIVGQNEDGDLEWIGTDKQWSESDSDDEWEDEHKQAVQ